MHAHHTFKDTSEHTLDPPEQTKHSPDERPTVTEKPDAPADAPELRRRQTSQTSRISAVTPKFPSGTLRGT